MNSRWFKFIACLTIICSIFAYPNLPIPDIAKPNEEQEMRSTFKRIKFKDHLNISIDSKTKSEILNEYLSLKLYENSDTLQLLQRTEFRILSESSFRIIKNNGQYSSNNNNFKIGSTSCSLEKVAQTLQINKPVPICPWHWEIFKREDIYPFKIQVAVCNCKNCQAKTIYDSDEFRLSECQSQNSFMPVLIRTYLFNNTEKWSFGFEEVPSSCVCAIKLNPYL